MVAILVPGHCRVTAGATGEERQKSSLRLIDANLDILGSFSNTKNQKDI